MKSLLSSSFDWVYVPLRIPSLHFTLLTFRPGVRPSRTWAVAERQGSIANVFLRVHLDECLLVCSAMNSFRTASEMSVSAAWMRLRTRAGVVIAMMEDSAEGA